MPKQHYNIESWLWPDHVIGKRESRRLREEHNHLVNELAKLRAKSAQVVKHFWEERKRSDELLAACKLWERAEKDGGVSMADLRTKASTAIRDAIAKVEGQQ